MFLKGTIYMLVHITGITRFTILTFHRVSNDVALTVQNPASRQDCYLYNHKSGAACTPALIDLHGWLDLVY